jgi:hypothetical protein
MSPHTLLSRAEPRASSSGSTELVFLRLYGLAAERESSERERERERDLLLLFRSPRWRRGGVNERLLDLRAYGEGERRLGALSLSLSLSRRGRGGEVLRERADEKERSRLGRRRLGERERESDLSFGDMGLSRLLTRSGDLLPLL